MTPYEEFMDKGTLGLIGYAWWKRQVRQIANAHNFPPPDGHRSWTDDASADWLKNAFIRRGREFVVKIAALASDDASYGRVVRTSIKNELIDGAKSTTVGKLRNRMRTILKAEPDFKDFTAQYGGTAAWTLDSLGGAIWQGDWHDLLRVPGLRAIGQIAHLNAAGPTSAQNRAKLVQAARAVLEGAGGAVTDLALARVLVKLFELEDLPAYLLGDEEVVTTDNALQLVETQVDAGKGWADPREYESAVGWLELVEHAEQLLAELSDEDRQTLSTLDEGMLGQRSAKFREIAGRLQTPPEAMLIAISKCAQSRFDD